MTEEIEDYFKNGILIPTFESQRNIFIWKNIAENIEILKKQEKHIQALYSFIQQSAQTNFIISLAKVYDTPNKRFPNRCILSFFDLIHKNINQDIEIIEKQSTKEIMRQNNCPEELVQSIENSEKFIRYFIEYYKDRYNQIEMKLSIDELKKMRDKKEAHNEVVDTFSLSFEHIDKLISFAEEVISIYGIAFNSTIWKSHKHSQLKLNAERNANFILENIEQLSR